MLPEQEDYIAPRRVGRPPIALHIVRMIIKLRKEKDMSYREISKELHVSHETCRRYCNDEFWTNMYQQKQDSGPS